MLKVVKLGLYLTALFLAGRLSAADAPVLQPKPPGRTNLPAATIVQTPDALRNFQVRRGFRLELAATEPLVINPVAMAFDENGRLFVIETEGNAGRTDNPRGRVRMLEDTDGSGTYNASAVYAKDLPSPSALICYHGGVFAACGGQILYLKDTKSDGLADVQREVFKSFGEATNGANGKVIVTGMAWGLDNHIHVATAGHGGDVISSSLPRQSLILTAGDFAFDPRTFQLSVESGSAPAGMCFDNRGRQYVADNSHHIQLVMYEYRYAARNSYYSMPGALLDIVAGDEGPGRLPGAGNFVIYRGNAFPPECAGSAFVADAATSLVHWHKLLPNDVELVADLAADELGTGFLACQDRSFEPTQLANAPDGTLYVAALLRETTVRSAAAGTNANLNRAEERGRIYRVAPVNFKRPKVPQMGKAKTTELAAMLQHPNVWQRETAARLLYERQDKAAIVPLVQLLYDWNSPPLARVHALHALEGMGMLAAVHLMKALNDPDDRVREHAVLLSEKFIIKNGYLPDILFDQFGRLAADVSPQVRYQLAFTLGQLNNPGRVQMLAAIIRSDVASRSMQSAVLSSLNEGAGEMFGLLAADANLRDAEAGGEFLSRLLPIIGAKNQPEELAQTLNTLGALPGPQLAFTLAQTLDDALQNAGSSLAAADTQGVLKPLYSRAAQLAGDENAAEPLRAQAIRLLAGAKYADPQTSMTLALEWPRLSDHLRSEAAVAMLSRPEWTASLLWGLERRLVPTSDLSSTQIRFLLAHPDQISRQRALNLFGNGGGGARREVVARFLPALQLTGTAERGHELFLARCAACHQSGGDGNPNGLDLAGTGKNGGEALLVRILDPNRETSPKYADYLLQTKEGQTLTGFISRQNAKSVTLCQANGVERVVGRQDIRALESLNTSAMPEGLEAGLNQQDMADLLEYLNPTAATR